MSYFWKRMIMVAGAALAGVGAVTIPGAAPFLAPVSATLMGWAVLRRPGDTAPPKP